MANQEKHSMDEEADFLTNLLSGLENANSHPTRSPPKVKRHSNAQNMDSSKRVSDADMLMLLDGAETWDWADMEADFMTPKKRKSSPAKDKRSPLKQKQSPVKQSPLVRRACSSAHPVRSTEHLDIEFLLNGAENWDWDDMESEVLSASSRSKITKVGSSFQ
ncbi:hypothetical protein EDC04DRAFT_713036 [Pisolithus marmoratus]|nr:hypothetical protein EDC04DRAFT_713036 [Pisolithus marmoratus]